MSESFYVYETKYKNPRKCEICGVGIAEGYLHEVTSTTLCTDYCVFKMFGVKHFERVLRTGEVFWATWYDEIEVVE